MAAAQTLKAVVLLEQDVNNDIVTWAFPSVDPVVENVIKKRSGLSSSGSDLSSLLQTPFRSSRFGNHWIYSYAVTLDSAVARQRKLTGACVAVLSSSYNPPKYRELTSILMRSYTDGEKEFSSLSILDIWLSVMTTNAYNGVAGKYEDNLFDQRRALIAPLKSFVKHLGEYSIYAFLAMLLKKRLFLYHPSLDSLFDFVRSCPLLGAWHRQEFGVLRPFVQMDDEKQVEDVANTHGAIVVGVIDSSAEERRDLYDLFIDCQAKKVRVRFGATGAMAPLPSEAPAPSAVDPAVIPKEFILLKMHKNTLTTIMSVANDSAQSDQALIKVVAQNVKELLDKIQTLARDDSSGSGKITKDGLANSGLQPGMQAFIFAVANAEGMAKK